MTRPALLHGSFSLERQIAAPPELVFQSWTNPEAKMHWFIGPENWTLVERRMDLRLGAEEILHGHFEDGMETVYAARYHLIEANSQLVYAYDMHVNGNHLSVSLASVEITKSGSGALMTYTEQAIYLDGEDGTASRRIGTDAHFERLDSYLIGRQ